MGGYSLVEEVVRKVVIGQGDRAGSIFVKICYQIRFLKNTVEFSPLVSCIRRELVVPLINYLISHYFDQNVGLQHNEMKILNHLTLSINEQH